MLDVLLCSVMRIRNGCVEDESDHRRIIRGSGGSL
jgi:hypothetical protein